MGKAGVSICHWRDMEQLLDGIPLAKINTSMTINATAPFKLPTTRVVCRSVARISNMPPRIAENVPISMKPLMRVNGQCVSCADAGSMA